ncbi:MAG: RNA 3'-terminal phosphate cyclase [Phycisphaeraceae bacterium]
MRLTAALRSRKLPGDAIGSQQLSFHPGAVTPGEYRFAIGTAGSTTLVLQTVLIPLLLADGPSRLVLEGGTHNPFAPPFDFLDRSYMPLIHRMGPSVSMTLERPGFYPAGGGRFVVDIQPCEKLRALQIPVRGEIVDRSARAVVSGLPLHIAERECEAICARMNWDSDCSTAEAVEEPRGPGNIVTMELESEYITEVFTGFGERDRSAEKVAGLAVQQVQRYLASGAAAGEYLTDQLLLPMAVAVHRGAEGCGFHAQTISRHSETHIELIHRFLNCRVTLEDAANRSVMVKVALPDSDSRS